ncbi:MAG TPA: hypothetical protein VFE05_02915, partial [Longimicrobiaceae bacterium]|nr:hypothetical protein [Longimicrobiaceae bacterium]
GHQRAMPETRPGLRPPTAPPAHTHTASTTLQPLERPQPAASDSGATPLHRWPPVRQSDQRAMPNDLEIPTFIRRQMD